MSIVIQSTDGHPSAQQIEDATVIFTDGTIDDKAVLALCNLGPDAPLDVRRDRVSLIGRAMILAGICGARYYSVSRRYEPTLLGYAVASPPGGTLFGTELQESFLGTFLLILGLTGITSFVNLYKDQFPKFVEEFLRPDDLGSVWWIHNLFLRETGDKKVMQELLDKILQDVRVMTQPPLLLATTVTRQEDTKFYVDNGFELRGSREFTSLTGKTFSLWLLLYKRY